MPKFEIEADITYIIPEAWVQYAETEADARDQLICSAIDSNDAAIDAEVATIWTDDPDDCSWWGRIHLHTAEVFEIECEYESTIQEIITGTRVAAEPNDGQIVKFKVTALKMIEA